MYDPLKYYPKFCPYCGKKIDHYGLSQCDGVVTYATVCFKCHAIIDVVKDDNNRDLKV